MDAGTRWVQPTVEQDLPALALQVDAAPANLTPRAERHDLQVISRVIVRQWHLSELAWLGMRVGPVAVDVHL